jgi:hypothetical protein
MPHTLLSLEGHVGEQAGLLLLLRLVSHSTIHAEQDEQDVAPAPE